jgi:hypothetical protein
LNISRIIKDLKICSNYLNKKNLISWRFLKVK